MNILGMWVGGFLIGLSVGALFAWRFPIKKLRNRKLKR